MIRTSESPSGWARMAPGMAVAAAGAALGGWMFGLRGAALFGGAGAAVAGMFRLRGARVSGWAAALALVVAAAALHSASTLGWAGADAPDGSRFKASPVGLSHVLTPHQLTSRTVDCGWHAASGYAAPCTVARGGEAAFRVLRTVYPTVLLAVLLCVAGAVLSLRPAWRTGAAQRTAAGGAAAAALAAVLLFAASVGDAVVPLPELSVGVGGTLGTMQLAAAVLLCLGACLAPRSPGIARPAEPGAGPGSD